MRIVIGPPVSGENFWGHIPLLNRIKDTLRTHSILLCAPRRFGKTSILYKLKESQTVKTVYCDLEATDDMNQFLSLILSETNAQIGLSARKPFARLFRRKMPDIAELTFEMRRITDDELINMWLRIVNSLDKDIYYYFDELSVFLRNLIAYDSSKKEVNRCLQILRKIRDSNSRLRFLFSSETEIFDLAAESTVGAYLNDLVTVTLPPWTREEGVEFVKKVFVNRGIDANEDVPEVLIEHLYPPVPFYVQVILESLISDITRDKEKPLTKKDVERCYQDFLREVGSRAYMDHYYSRISNYYKDIQRDIAFKVLKFISTATTDNVSVDEIVSMVRSDPQLSETTIGEQLFVINSLESQGYLTIKDEKVAMSSRFLRDWWKLHHVFRV